MAPKKKESLKDWKDRMVAKLPKFTVGQLIMFVVIVLVLLSGISVSYKGCEFKKDPIKIKENKK